MRFDGLWLTCTDGEVRPVIVGEVLADSGAWIPVSFLIDTGADRTLLSGTVAGSLALPLTASANRLAGAGGIISFGEVATKLRFHTSMGKYVDFRGNFAAATDPATVDMSILGRDVTDLLTLIVDRPGDQVTLLGPGHACLIQP